MSLGSETSGRGEVSTHHKVAQKHSNGNLANAGDINTGLLLNRGTVKVLEAGEVDAHGTVTEQLGGHLELLGRDTANNDVAERQDVLELPALLVVDLVAQLTDALAASEDLDAGDVDGVDGGAVVGEQSSERATVNLATVDDGDGLAEQAVAVGEDGIVDLQVLEGLDDGERSAGEDGLLQVGGRVEEADVMVHVEEVGVAETFDVFGEGDGLLDVLVLAVVADPDGVIDEDAVDVVVVVGGDDALLEVFLVDLAEIEVEATE